MFTRNFCQQRQPEKQAGNRSSRLKYGRGIVLHGNIDILQSKWDADDFRIPMNRHDQLRIVGQFFRILDF